MQKCQLNSEPRVYFMLISLLELKITLPSSLFFWHRFWPIPFIPSTDGWFMLFRFIFGFKRASVTWYVSVIVSHNAVWADSDCSFMLRNHGQAQIVLELRTQDSFNRNLQWGVGKDPSPELVISDSLQRPHHLPPTSTGMKHKTGSSYEVKYSNSLNNNR